MSFATKRVTVEKPQYPIQQFIEGLGWFNPTNGKITDISVDHRRNDVAIVVTQTLPSEDYYKTFLYPKTYSTSMYASVRTAIEIFNSIL